MGTKPKLEKGEVLLDSVKDFLVKICDETSISGYETVVADMICEEFSKLCDEVTIDRFGNVIGLKKGTGQGKMMFAAHMDEIGLMVTKIDERGLVRFTKIGGYDQRTLLGQEVFIHGREKVFGVIGLKPPHLSTPEDQKKSVPIKDMAIDTGYTAEKLRELVCVGDLVSVKRNITELKNNLLAGKSLDDKAGVASLIYCMKQLQHYRHSADLYFVATSQEEVGVRGAGVAADVIKPDIAIAIDVSFAKMTGLNEYVTMEMGKGPSIGLGPNMHRKVYEMMVKAAKAQNVPYQIKVSPGMSGTDAISIQVSGEGVATGLISIPLKYMHTSTEVVSMDDVEQSGRLMAACVMELTGQDLEGILCC